MVRANVLPKRVSVPLNLKLSDLGSLTMAEGGRALSIQTWVCHAVPFQEVLFTLQPQAAHGPRGPG